MTSAQAQLGLAKLALVSAEQLQPRWTMSRTEYRYTFYTFYHPYTCDLVAALNLNGVDGLMQRSLQLLSDEKAPRFKSVFDPAQGTNALVDPTYPLEEVEFEYGTGYAQYNWELFFHIPLLIAERLHQNQRFDEAQQWFHYIFDPTDRSSADVPQRYWRTKPFYLRTRDEYQQEHIANLMLTLALGGNPDAIDTAMPGLSASEKTLLLQEIESLKNAVAAWRADPFNPHLVAQTRTTAYQKTVVMKYIDNLIDWGDQLFRRDTIESINEATQLYVLAGDLLGKRPDSIPPRTRAAVYTYNTLAPILDDFSNALVEVEAFVPPSAPAQQDGGQGGTMPLPSTALMLYFCVPKNDKLLSYWDTIADRLFKIRNSMNIEGVVRQLALFDPPIDPGLLVKAAAAGLDISSVLNEINAALPIYRFQPMTQKATELCGELKALSGALLAALEKRDGEQLSTIRAVHELNINKLVEQVRRTQIDESNQNLSALRASRQIAVTRWLHYEKLLGYEDAQAPEEGASLQDRPTLPQVTFGEDDGLRLLSEEINELDNMRSAQDAQESAGEFETFASIAHIIPNWNVEPWGVGATFGGSNVGAALSAFASWFRMDASESSYKANRASRRAAQILRAHEWTLQNNLAAKEIMNIDQQILAAELRISVAEHELKTQQKQVEQAKEVLDFLRGKYTNQQLYQWMIGQISGVYFQAYQLAYDVAKRAEQCYRYELGLASSNFVQFGYWDSLKKGLMAGERLQHDLKRMEVAYLDKNRREYEIIKHISLVRLDPAALLELKQTGTCYIRVPEALFDMDYPGHYMRRIKSVSVTVPCVAGPQTSVSCTLTLTRSSMRHSGNLTGGVYARDLGNDDMRFTDRIGAIESIVTSSGQNDAGLFETNLRDERYLPFEGAGVISEWRITLPSAFKSFDYDTIADVILHVRYTAREGGGLLKDQAITELNDAINLIQVTAGDVGLERLVCARTEFSAQWHRFRYSEGASNVLSLPIEKGRFPFVFQGKEIAISRVEVFAKVTNAFASNTTVLDSLRLSLVAGDTPASAALPLSERYGLLYATLELSSAADPGDWTLSMWLDDGSPTPPTVGPDVIQDIFLLYHYTIGA
jgi:hypothetical protein